MKDVKLSLETAKAMYRGGDASVRQFALDNYTKQELEKESLPERWEDLGHIPGYYISGGSGFGVTTGAHSYDSNRNVVPTKKDAEAILALCQLLQLRNKYRQGWAPPTNNKERIFSHCVQPRSPINFTSALSSWFVTPSWMPTSLFTFQDRETALLFIENFEDLLDKVRHLFIT